MLGAAYGPGQRTGWVSPLRYNLTISHSHRFVWFRVAKVASRTVRHHFTVNGVELDVDHAMRIRYPTAAFADYFKFAFVRDPLARFVSAWQDKVVNNNYYRFEAPDLERMQQLEEFAGWVSAQDLSAVPGTDQHLALQSRLIDLSQVDFVGRIIRCRLRRGVRAGRSTVGTGPGPQPDPRRGVRRRAGVCRGPHDGETDVSARLSDPRLLKQSEDRPHGGRTGVLGVRCLGSNCADHRSGYL